ncbi:MAG: hypothetical protein JSR56_06305 [Proteobacteria bacterium]|nr:hypothetical protein [Pseudomonadota bacterium]
MRRLAVLACMAIAMLGLDARAAARVELIGTWPAGGSVTLGRNQTFYLHLHYTSDVPVNIWARPYFQGKPANAGSNPSRVYPAGSGEALGWFFLFDPGAQVDEVRISAGDGSYNRTPVVATFPVSVAAGDEPAEDTPQPEWLASLTAIDQAVQRADREKAANAPVSRGDLAFMRGFMLTMLALGLLTFAWPAWGLWRWRSGWRIAAAVPAIVMGFVVLRIIIDGMRDPTSHNLWPFEIIMWGVMGCGWMLVLTLARSLVGSKQA